MWYRSPPEIDHTLLSLLTGTYTLQSTQRANLKRSTHPPPSPAGWPCHIRMFSLQKCLACVVCPTMNHEKTSRPSAPQDSGSSLQPSLGGYKQIVRGSLGDTVGNPSWQQQPQQPPRTKPLGDDSGAASSTEKEKLRPSTTAPSSLMMLRHRQEPLPFILPQPLGPLPTPAQYTAAAAAAVMLPTARRELSWPVSLPPMDYQWDVDRRPHPRPGPRPSNHDSMMRQPFPTFLPPPPSAASADITRRQSLGSLTNQSPHYLPPPLPAYPRRSTSPAFRQQSQQLQPQPQPQYQPSALTTRPSGVGHLAGGHHHQHHQHQHHHHAPTFWPSSPSSSTTSEGRAPHASARPGSHVPLPVPVPVPGPVSEPFPLPPLRRPSPRSSPASEHVRFQCDQCPENFPTNGVLKRHKKTHSARKYRCGCGAAYTDKSVLRVSEFLFFFFFCKQDAWHSVGMYMCNPKKNPQPPPPPPKPPT